MSDEKAPEEISEVGPIVADMWLALAQEAKRYAMACAKDNVLSEAVKAAKYAEAFYWRSTGEGEAIDLTTDSIS